MSHEAVQHQLETPRAALQSAHHILAHGGCSWELYHLDCKQLSPIVRDHELQPKISGTSSLCSPLLVVEFDLPWDDAQASTYGPEFKAWTELDFEMALAALKDACPHNDICVVVFF